MNGTDELVWGAVTDATREIAERMEYEVRGAWRAGYEYLHVYDEIQGEPIGGEDRVTIRQYVFPSYNPQRPDPSGLQYRYTYDLTSVPDHVIRAAIRGEDTRQ